MREVKHGDLCLTSAYIISKLLEDEIWGQFVSSQIEGVETREISPDRWFLIPPEITAELEKLHGRVRKFLLVRASQSIPMHEHLSDGVVYLGGDYVSHVTLRNQSGTIDKFIMLPRLFSIIDAGVSHGVEMDPSVTEMVFLEIVFEVD